MATIETPDTTGVQPATGPVGVLSDGGGLGCTRADAARSDAARRVYDAECALHNAHQAARGALGAAEASQCDRWVAAAYTHLHEAHLRYLAALPEHSGPDHASPQHSNPQPTQADAA